jgi:hypothetical protein
MITHFNILSNGAVACMGEKRTAYRILVGKKPLGRPGQMGGQY